MARPMGTQDVRAGKYRPSLFWQAHLIIKIVHPWPADLTRISMILVMRWPHTEKRLCKMAGEEGQPRRGLMAGYR